MTRSRRSGLELFWLIMIALYAILTIWGAILVASGEALSPFTWVSGTLMGALAVGSWLAQRNERRKRIASQESDDQ